MGILFVRTPPVHVELHRREGLPLEVSRIDRKVAASEDAIHVGSDVGLAGKTRTDICRDVETYVLPLAARLVSGPHTGITLRAGPPVERDDKWTGITAIVRHDLRNVGYAVQSERISGTDPCHVGLKHTHTRITHLLDDVALQQGAHLGFRMQVRLRPETDLDTLPAGIVAQRLQVADIAVEGLLLSVPGTVTVVGKQPSERHVVSRITVDHRTRRELIVVLLAVERLLHTAIVALALLVTLAVLEEYTLLILCPIVPVIRIQMSLIETELGQQHGIARKLVIVVQKRHGRRIHHNEEIEIIRIVRQRHTSRLRGPEIISTLAEGVPHDTITSRRPIERRRRSHTAVSPAVLVLDGDNLALVRKTAVLHAAAVEILLRLLAQYDRHAAVAELYG